MLPRFGLSVVYYGVDPSSALYVMEAGLSSFLLIRRLVGSFLVSGRVFRSILLALAR